MSDREYGLGELQGRWAAFAVDAILRREASAAARSPPRDVPAAPAELPHRRRPDACGRAYLWCVARPVEALAAMPLEARRFEDLGALAAMPLETRRFADLGRYQFEAMIERVSAAEQHAAELLGGRTVWMVNSTALGGGVAQLLRTLLPYWRGAGIDVRWVVLRGSAEFFRVTKRLHNQLQGQPGDGGVLGVDELATLDRAAHDHARALASLLAPGDLVVLNDPQTAAMS
ncbi:MAG TPA: hypothetical protein VII03_02200, partial [Solirubrobacteraceae bacterium]